MAHLRKMMLEELERRNYAQTTIDCYIQTIEDFARQDRETKRGRAPGLLSHCRRSIQKRRLGEGRSAEESTRALDHVLASLQGL